jgi:hypothetical protein
MAESLKPGGVADVLSQMRQLGVMARPDDHADG